MVALGGRGIGGVPLYGKGGAHGGLAGVAFETGVALTCVCCALARVAGTTVAFGSVSSARFKPHLGGSVWERPLSTRL
eukprot:7855420-Lingulodinium_polyedra.AAC.1